MRLWERVRRAFTSYRRRSVKPDTPPTRVTNANYDRGWRVHVIEPPQPQEMDHTYKKEGRRWRR